MNKTLQEGMQLVNDVVAKYSDASVELIIAPPLPYLTTVKDLAGKGIKVAAQNCNHNAYGAFTGEVSAAMLASIQTDYVIIGHSERREYNKETNQQLADKINLALQNDLKPIFCCGESLELRNNGDHFDWITKQLKESLFHLDEIDIQSVVIAYEPIWAIGTGETATKEQAQEVHAHIRNLLIERYEKEVAEEISILYGGSCNPRNAQELFSQEDIDGGLIGGASLKAEDFIAIAESF